MKVCARVLLLIVVLSSVAYAQTKLKAKSKLEKVFIEVSIPNGGKAIKLEIPREPKTGAGFAGDRSCYPSPCKGLKGYSGGAVIVKQTRNFVVVGVSITLKGSDGKEIKIARNISVRKDEFVEITFKNGIKVKAYFENIEEIIKQEKSNNA